MKLWWTIFLAVAAQVTWAQCQVSGPHTLYANASYEDGTSFSYKPNGRDFVENPRVQISGCDKESSSRKFLMIGFGADYHGLNSDTASVAYNGSLLEDTCRIENNPFASFYKFDQRAEIHSKKTQFLNQCASIVIRHAGQKNLRNISNPNCQLEMADSNTAYLRGGYCFFRIYPDSYFEVTAQLNPECANSEFLKDNDIDPAEVFSHVNFFTAGEASGLSQDLTPLKSVAVRYTVEPESSLVPTSERYFDLMPRWPNQWVMPEVHPGEIGLKKLGRNFTFETNLFVDHRCPKYCRNGLCSSPCEYAAPVSGEYRLYRVGNRGIEFIDSWYAGAIAPPHWQGKLPSDFHNLGELSFEIGERYLLEFVMNNPKEDFIFLNKQAESKLLSLSGLKLSEMEIGDELPEINTDWEIEAIKSIDSIASVGHKNGLYILRDLDLGLSELKDFYYWPPYYSEVCDSNRVNCLSPRVRDYLKLQVAFTIKKQEGRKFQLGDFIIKRESPLLKDYQKTLDSMPFIECKSL